MNRFFISGIGTNVGKTLVSAILCEALQADYWKPIQCGVAEGRDKDIVKKLLSNSKSICHDETFLLKEPASPHIAAKKENIKITMDELKMPQTLNKLCIEGAGGPLVPINDNYFVIDMAKQNGLAVVLVVSSYLGCINHSLLAIDYLLNNNFKLHGLVLNGDFDEGVKNAITNYKRVPVLAEIPQTDKPDKKFVSEQASKVNVHLL
ncbi:MAG TPA: dethiobiotin synthase [Bacteroidia bacterium]|jgi:dethiobiotin synthetase|nr:dethiobiotin synthase [Bacteroidia bacterium]